MKKNIINLIILIGIMFLETLVLLNMYDWFLKLFTGIKISYFQMFGILLFANMIVFVSKNIVAEQKKDLLYNLILEFDEYEDSSINLGVSLGKAIAILFFWGFAALIHLGA